MPYKRKMRKRPMYKRKPRRSNKVNISSFPSNRVVKMRYVGSYEFTGASGVLDKYQFRLNGINDPDYTGIGHQPLGHDQWAMFYQEYIVLGAKVTVKWVFESGAQAVAVGGFIGPSTTLTATSYDLIEEQGKSKSRILPQSLDTRPVILTHYFSTKKFYNLANVNDNKDSVGAVFGNNPTDQAILTIYAQALDKTTSIICQAHVTIDYIVSLGKPKELAQS